MLPKGLVRGSFFLLLWMTIDLVVVAKVKSLQFHDYVLYQNPHLMSQQPHLHVHHCPFGHAHIADQANCHIFYHCQASFWGTKMVRKSCGHLLMFNIETSTCDWPYRVRHARPECRHETGKPVQGLWRPMKFPTLNFYRKKKKRLRKEEQQKQNKAQETKIDNEIQASQKVETQQQEIASNASVLATKDNEEKSSKIEDPQIETSPEAKADEETDADPSKMETKSANVVQGPSPGSQNEKSNPSMNEKVQRQTTKTRRWKSIFSPANGKFNLSSMKVFKPKEFSALQSKRRGEGSKAKTNKFIKISILA